MSQTRLNRLANQFARGLSQIRSGKHVSLAKIVAQVPLNQIGTLASAVKKTSRRAESC